MTMRHIDRLGIALERATGGPFSWGHLDPDVPTMEHLAAMDRMTREHGDSVDRLWVINTAEGEPLTVAMTGNGPTSERNAEAIAQLLSMGPYLMNVFFTALITCEAWPEDERLRHLRDALAPLLGVEEV